MCIRDRPWLDGPVLRRWLPWTGSWQAGDGARVFPLQLADGREIPVLPLICLDDVDVSLAPAGTRLGAQAVPYTHLDVYKRQMHTCSASSRWCRGCWHWTRATRSPARSRAGSR